MKQDFEQTVDALFEAITATLEVMAPDIDIEEQQGIMTLTLPGGDQCVLSRQTARQEIWLASRYGAFHFQAVTGGQVTKWQTKTQESLAEVLSATLAHLTGQVIRFDKI